MAKSFGSGSFGKAPKVTGKVGSGVPGDFSRARMTESQGEKVTSAPGTPIAASKTPSPGNVAVATGDNIVAPVDHPSATTTRRVSRGGTL